MGDRERQVLDARGAGEGIVNPKACAAALALSALALALALASCAGREPEARSERIFSSNVVLRLRDHGSGATFDSAFARLKEIDGELAMWNEGSGLAALNRAAGSGPRRVSADLLAVASRGLELARSTEGIFDPTVGPLVRLWGIGGPSPRLPSRGEEAAARALVGWSRVAIDADASAIALERGMALDFGALAKGYGAMEAARLLKGRGLRSGLVDVGGCVIAIGSGPRGEAWKIGVQDPGAPRGSPLGYFSVRDSAVDTSGCYERYFEKDGRRYPHIFDTRTGLPVDGSTVSATVVTPLSINSDGPPLALIVLGPRDGLALAERLGLPAVIIDDHKNIYLSSRAKAIFTLTNPAYRLSSNK